MSIGSNNEVVIDADGDRLGVAKARRRRVTTGAGVVVVKTDDRIVEQVTTEVGELIVELSAQPLFQTTPLSCQ